eukprot:CAMPEP_0169077364 /NCGR_PEP_ID=MMETSP1015-20121227/8839_1 /TAXON_ID=342587 /ORGANISM="Karlodinium micrum, Strain CCMP2283" /LENGTH=70 /DNA_ID=CAMNT_0009136883 /DNA_START=437 /DNA_END=649 /DNA_ORIENTATION=+
MGPVRKASMRAMKAIHPPIRQLQLSAVIAQEPHPAMRQQRPMSVDAAVLLPMPALPANCETRRGWHHWFY